jgi:hypothetical protein
MTAVASVAVPAAPAETVRFREVQTNPRAWLAIAAMVLLLIVPSLWRLVEDFPDGRWVFDAVQLLLYGVLVACFSGWKLVTELSADALHIRYSRALKQVVPLSSIKSVEVVPYYPRIDGAWGVRRGQALRIWVSAGDFVLLGTQRPDELRELLAGAPPAA